MKVIFTGMAAELPDQDTPVTMVRKLPLAREEDWAMEVQPIMAMEEVVVEVITEVALYLGQQLDLTLKGEVEAQDIQGEFTLVQCRLE